MTAKVIKFEPATIGEGYRFDPDEILEESKGQDFTTLAILGETEDGAIWVSGNSNVGEILILLERAKRHLVFGEDP